MNIPPEKLRILRNVAALALHENTCPAEVEAAARGFFRILREAKVTPEGLLDNGGPRTSSYVPPPAPPPRDGTRPFFSFGKYQGLPIEAVPTSYLLWVLDNLKKLNPLTVREINHELDKRRRR